MMKYFKKQELLIERLVHDQVPELKLNAIQQEMKSSVEKKVKEGIYSFEKADCPICEKEQATVVGQKDRYGLFYQTNLCNSCGLLYTNPRMTQESYNQFYNLEYRRLYGGQESPTQLFFDRQVVRGRSIYNYLTQKIGLKLKNCKILEVGCGAGGILHYFKTQGNIVKGIDLGKEYIEYGRTHHNLDLTNCSLSELEVFDKPDVIIYAHVMEHILDLKGEIDIIRKISHENTVVYIEVPGLKEIHRNFEMNILKYFQNAHTYHFTLDTLKNLMEKYGFELISGNQFVMAAFRLSSQKKSLQNDFQDSKRYILEVEKSRKRYPFTAVGLSKMIKHNLLKLFDKTNTRVFIRRLKTIFD